MGQPPDITIIMCTYNRADWLHDALQSLAGLETGGKFTYEVLVVDNASTDRTAEVLAELMGQYPVPARTVVESKPGPAPARNCGVRHARGRWIAFFDDDQQADPLWLLELFALAQQKNCSVVGGAVQLVAEADRNHELSPYLKKLLAPGGRRRTTCRLSPKNGLNNGNAMIHRRVFEQVGLYNESCTGGGEDTDLFQRLHRSGIAAWYTPRAIVRHRVPGYRLSRSYLRWASMRQGWTFAQSEVKRRGKSAALLLALLRIAKAGAHDAPRLVGARVRRAADEQLYRRGAVWRTEGYVRSVLCQLVPQLFPQNRFRSWIDFRGERQRFAAPSPSKPIASSTRGVGSSRNQTERTVQ